MSKKFSFSCVVVLAALAMSKANAGESCDKALQAVQLAQSTQAKFAQTIANDFEGYNQAFSSVSSMGDSDIKSFLSANSSIAASASSEFGALSAILDQAVVALKECVQGG